MSDVTSGKKLPLVNAERYPCLAKALQDTKTFTVEVSGTDAVQCFRNLLDVLEQMNKGSSRTIKFGWDGDGDARLKIVEDSSVAPVNTKDATQHDVVNVWSGGISSATARYALLSSVLAAKPRKPKPATKKLTRKQPSVKVPKGYLPFVDGEGDLGQLDSWTVQVQLGNSVGRGEPGVGGWGKVGYVFVNPKTQEIIPIARSDEHRSGWDLMHDLHQKGIVKNLKDWGAVYRHGTHVYDSEDKEPYRKIFQTWLDLGGPDISVEIYRSGSVHTGETFLGTLSGFIKAKSFVPKAGQLAAPGKELIQALEKFARAVVEALQNPAREQQAFRAAGAIPAVLKRYRIYSWSKQAEALETALASGEFQALQDAILGFDGFKNTLHQELRDAVKDPKDWRGDNVRKVFGDVEAALKAFDALGAI